MSIRVELDTLTVQQKQKIIKDLRIKVESKNKWVQAFDMDETSIFLPYAYARQLGFSSKPRTAFPQVSVHFNGTLREYQKEVKSEAVKNLNEQGSCILALHVGWGKTKFAIYLACKLKFKTLFVTNRVVLVEQMIEEIRETCPSANVQYVKPNKPLDETCDFYVVNATNIPKFERGFFACIGTIVCDEVHLLCAFSLFKFLFYLSPRYCIALSATPYRPDELGLLIQLYFGSNQIVKKLYRNHHVFPIMTNLELEYKLNWEGKTDWNSLLESQSTHVQRNEMIVDLVCALEKRNVLVLCKRVDHVETLTEKLRERNQHVTVNTGKKKEVFDKEARIVVATVQKCGVGFSHNKLDTLIIAADMEEYYIQYMGRVFRTPDSEPVIFDIVDTHPSLRRHFATRKKVYKDVGGTITAALKPVCISKIDLKKIVNLI